jgi:protein TonB
MPLSFALVPVPASAHGAASRPDPGARRESRLFHSSAIACGIALAIYVLLAVALPRSAPPLRPIAPYPDSPPWNSLPLPQVERPQAPGPPQPPARAEPSPEPQAGGRVSPGIEPAEPAAGPGTGTGEPATTENAGGRDPGAGTGAPREEAGGAGGIADYYEEPPVPLREIRPVYPDFAADAGITGTVLLHVLVGVDGRVEDVRVLHSVPVLNDAAIEAARRWIFRPARVSGRAVRVWVALPMRFELH